MEEYAVILMVGLVGYVIGYLASKGHSNLVKKAKEPTISFNHQVRDYKCSSKGCQNSARGIGPFSNYCGIHAIDKSYEV